VSSQPADRHFMQGAQASVVNIESSEPVCSALGTTQPPLQTTGVRLGPHFDNPFIVGVTPRLLIMWALTLSPFSPSSDFTHWPFHSTVLFRTSTTAICLISTYRYIGLHCVTLVWCSISCTSPNASCCAQRVDVYIGVINTRGISRTSHLFYRPCFSSLEFIHWVMLRATLSFRAV